MTDNEKTIYTSLKSARICCIISIISITVGTIFTLIFEHKQIATLSRMGDGFMTFSTFLSIVILSIGLIFSILRMLSVPRIKSLANPETLNKDFKGIVLLAFLSCPLIYALLFMLLFPIGYCFYLMGTVFNISIIATIVLQILVIRVHIFLKYEHQERIKHLPHYIAEDNKISETNNLLSQVGKNFFVKYYEKLKNWDNADILGEIEESYEDNTKLTRIEAGKKIFSKNLNLVALKIISEAPTNSISDETKTKVNKLIIEENNS